MQGIKGPVLFSLLLVSIIAFAGRSAVVDSNSGLKDLIRKLSVVSDDPARSVMSSLPSSQFSNVTILQDYSDNVYSLVAGHFDPGHNKSEIAVITQHNTGQQPDSRLWEIYQTSNGNWGQSLILDGFINHTFIESVAAGNVDPTVPGDELYVVAKCPPEPTPPPPGRQTSSWCLSEVFWNGSTWINRIIWSDLCNSCFQYLRPAQNIKVAIGDFDSSEPGAEIAVTSDPSSTYGGGVWEIFATNDTDPAYRWGYRFGPLDSFAGYIRGLAAEDVDFTHPGDELLFLGSTTSGGDSLAMISGSGYNWSNSTLVSRELAGARHISVGMFDTRYAANQIVLSGGYQVLEVYNAGGSWQVADLISDSNYGTTNSVIGSFDSTHDGNEMAVGNSSGLVELYLSGGVVSSQMIWLPSQKMYSHGFPYEVGLVLNDFDKGHSGMELALVRNTVSSPNFIHTVTEVYQPGPSSPVQVLDYRIGPPSGRDVHAVINVTLTSDFVISAHYHLRLEITDPQGSLVFDNFQGIGGPADKKDTILTNGTISQVVFSGTLPPLITGQYDFDATVYQPDDSTVSGTTDWSLAFIVSSSPNSRISLGIVQPGSSSSKSLDISLRQFESSAFILVTSSPLQFIRFTFHASTGSRLSLAMNDSDSSAQTQLRFDTSSMSWTVPNVPSSSIELLVTSLTQFALVSSVDLQAGPSASLSSVGIISVDRTSGLVTPGGNVNLHLGIGWNISKSDTLEVSATISGSTVSQTFKVYPLSENLRSVYLVLAAPSVVGNYAASITARLLATSVSSSSQTSFDVRANSFNITVQDYVQYYRVSRSWIFWTHTDYLDDPSQLSALDVQNVKIINTRLDGRGQPTSANITLTAHNKLASEILPFVTLGEGVHYEVRIQFGTDPSIPLGVVLAGETENFTATNIPVVDGKLRFTITYSIWWIGELVEIGAAAVQPIIDHYTALWEGLVPRIVDMAKDLARLTLLYSLKAMMFAQGNLSDEDVTNILGELPTVGASIEFTRLYIECKDVARNPSLCMWGALVNLVTEKKVDLGWVLPKAVRLVTFVFLRTHLEDILGNAIKKAFNRFNVPVEVSSVSEEDAKHLQNVFQVGLDIVELLVTVGRLLTAPLEEGKIVGTRVSASPARTIDPIAFVTYSGPLDRTSLQFFSPIEIAGHVSSTGGQVTITADQNVTSLLLVPLSDSLFQHRFFSDFGLNASASSLDWKVTQNQFLLSASGQMYPGIEATDFSTNKTWLQGSQSILFNADLAGENTFLINQTMTYPLGTNLTITISVQLPAGSTNIVVLTPGYKILGTDVTWTTPVDRVVILFSIIRHVPPQPCALTDITCSLVLQETVAGVLAVCLGTTLVTFHRRSTRKKADRMSTSAESA